MYQPACEADHGRGKILHCVESWRGDEDNSEETTWACVRFTQCEGNPLPEEPRESQAMEICSRRQG